MLIFPRRSREAPALFPDRRPRARDDETPHRHYDEANLAQIGSERVMMNNGFYTARLLLFSSFIPIHFHDSAFFIGR
jgi:hypothetical protein